MSTLDEKIVILNEKYKDNYLVRTLMNDVEDQRWMSTLVGISTTGILFALNEYSWFAFWSPLFKLSPLNTLLLLTVPTFVAKCLYTEDVNDRVKNTWRIHKNWENKGLGGTYESSQAYIDKINEIYLYEYPL